MAGPILTMPYKGGKSYKPVGPWVASHLPEFVDFCVEPFLGMGGVLVNRTPAALEWANDADGSIEGWWRTLSLPDLT